MPVRFPTSLSVLRNILEFRPLLVCSFFSCTVFGPISTHASVLYFSGFRASSRLTAIVNYAFSPFFATVPPSRLFGVFLFDSLIVALTPFFPRSIYLFCVALSFPFRHWYRLSSRFFPPSCLFFIPSLRSVPFSWIFLPPLYAWVVRAPPFSNRCNTLSDL